MDALSDVLRVVRLTGGVFLDARFSAPWALAGNVRPEEMRLFLASPSSQVIGFHYIVSGRLVAHVLGGEPVELGPGEIVLLPRNDLHVLGSAYGLTPEPASEVVMPDPGAGIWRVAHGGGGEETHIVCGYLGGASDQNPLIASLPQLLTLNVAETPGGAWIAQSFAFAAQQLAEGAAGGATVISKLSELMFVEAVRRYIETLPPEETGWLAGLRDPAVGRAMALMHTRAAEDWTAETLAGEVNLSRSAFADRFTQLVGMPPMKYLTTWRMQAAAQRLRDTRQTIAQIAYDVGYESEAAFTRAFRREMGQPPATWRKQATLA
jgi:AraC-like DNA-binding protein